MNSASRLVDEFERLWSADSPPVLEKYLHGNGAADAALLARLARIDQAERWLRGERPQTEEYLNRIPALQGDDESAVDLIYHEYLLREQYGERPSVDEFTSRFPRHAAAISEQVRLHDALSDASTAVGTDGAAGQSLCDERTTSQTSAFPQNVSDGLGELGRYSLLSRVGTGSFGVVYRAHDSELDRTVAIKIPLDGKATDRDEMERFWREARSVARLRHPSIVTVYEVGRFEQTPFLVSEFVVGTTLAEVLASRRLLPRETAALVADLADALHYAHEMGVVHRDVKPANVMLDETGRPRLMDFGLARREAGDKTMTLDGDVLGTPAYMSPEQARGQSRSVDRRSDVYSLGVILYQALVGDLPFQGAARMVLHQVLHEEPRMLRSINRQTPRDLETTCLRAMAKEPAGRYATARDLADDLRRFLRNEPIRARPVTAVERAWRWSRRKPALAGLTAVVGVLLVALALGGTAVVSLLLGVIAVGGSAAAVQFRRQALKEQRLRGEADDNLYYYRVALAHRDLTAEIPQPTRAVELLEACPPEWRHWEWHYLKRLAQSDPIVLQAPDSREIRGVDFRPDGRQFAAACGDGRIRVWNQHAQQTVELAGHDGYAYSVAFHPNDSNRLASSGSDGRVRVWDVASGREAIAPLPGIKSYAVGLANCVVYSPDGQRLAAASDPGVVHIWDAGSGAIVHSLAGHEVRASCVAFSRDGRLLATGSWSGMVRIWDALSGRLLQEHQLPEHRYPVSCLKFSPDPSGRLLAAGYFDSRVDVWDVPARAVRQRLRGHTGFVTSVAFHSHDGRRLASAGEDRTVRIWDVPSGRPVLQLQGHLDNCSGLAFSPNGRQLVSASYDQTIRLWDATTLDAREREELQVFELESEAWCVAFSPDGKHVAVAGEGTSLQLREVVTGNTLRNFPSTFAGVVFSIGFSPDGRRLAASGFDNGAPPCVVKVLDLLSGQCVLDHREGHEIFAVAFSPDGQWLALGLADGSIKLADADSGRAILVGQHDRPISYGGLKFRPDGLHLASASLDGRIRIWNVRDVIQAGGATGSLGTTSLRDRLLCQMSSADLGVAFWSLSYSPDGEKLIGGDKNGQLTMWDAETGAMIRANSDAARGAYLSVAFSPDNRWVVTGSEDCAVRVYDERKLRLVRIIKGHMGPIHCLAVSDRFIATGGRDKSVRIWELSLDNDVEAGRDPGG